jgi:hypothetical protein
MDGILRTGVLNSFEGITNVPVAMDYEVYVNILRRYFFLRYPEGCLRRIVVKALHHARFLLASFADYGDRLLSSDEFDTIIAVFYEGASDAFDSLKGRMVIIEYMEDWKKMIYSWHSLHDEPHFHNNEAIIDRISDIASSKFCFYSSDEEKWRFPHGLIRTNGLLLLEVWRHQNATAAFYNGDGVDYVGDLLSQSEGGEDEESDDSDEEEEEEEEEDEEEGDNVVND